MIAQVIAILQGILQVIPIISKYFPPPTPEGKIESDQKNSTQEEQGVKEGGRPTWN